MLLLETSYQGKKKLHVLNTYGDTPAIAMYAGDTFLLHLLWRFCQQENVLAAEDWIGAQGSAAYNAWVLFRLLFKENCTQAL